MLMALRIFWDMALNLPLEDTARQSSRGRSSYMRVKFMLKPLLLGKQVEVEDFLLFFIFTRALSTEEREWPGSLRLRVH